MGIGAQTPEELETLFEDAFLLRDVEAVLSLFDDGAILVPATGAREARGSGDIAKAARLMWEQDRIYVASASHVLQARDTALLQTEFATGVMRRDARGVWRYAISLLNEIPHRRWEP